MDTTNECVLWTGRIDRSTGYGRLGQTTAHRVSWALANHQPIPDDHEIAHTCDVRACVNPVHLFLATHAENMADQKAKGRNVKGETVGTHKLTAQQVGEIRSRLVAGEKQTALAREYGVTQQNVSAIKRMTWRHV